MLHWHRPMAVWAMDHADPPRPIEGRWPHILAVRDLASGCQLGWLPVLDETAETTIAALQWLFLEHSAPLVLKSDKRLGLPDLARPAPLTRSLAGSAPIHRRGRRSTMALSSRATGP